MFCLKLGAPGFKKNHGNFGGQGEKGGRFLEIWETGKKFGYHLGLTGTPLCARGGG